MAKASNADIVATQAIERALSYAGVGLLDHIIVAGGKCASAKRNYIVPDTRKYKK
ncbi:MAG: hypothetical protein IJH17_08530 [Clostridia bacterium]|nr:hypothetical protein [Clostridia bacterium]